AYNEDQHIASRRYLSQVELQKLTQGVGLPDGAGQTAARQVYRQYVKFVTSCGQNALDPAQMETKPHGISVSYIRAKGSKLYFSRPLGATDYLAPLAVRAVLESEGTHLKGAYLFYKNGLWRAVIFFARRRPRRIDTDVATAKAVAKGYCFNPF